MRWGGSGLESGGRVEGASPLTAPHRPSPCRPLTLPSPLRGEGYREERPLENGVAAVDDEGVAGVVAARVAGEVDHDPAEVAAGAPAPRGHPRDHAGLEALPGHRLPGHPGPHPPRPH